MDISVCPNCGSGDIEYGDVAGSTLYDRVQDCSCDDCSTEWDIYFTAVQIEITTEGKE